jgi:hypothetical protein
MDSELRRQLKTLEAERSSPSDSQLPEQVAERGNRLLREAGIDLERDVDRVFAGLTGEDGTAHDRPLVLARGRFDDDLIETLVRQRGGDVETYRDVRLLTHQDGTETVGLAFVEPDLVALGTATAVRAALDTRAGAAPSLLVNERVMTLIREVDQGTAWVVGRFDAVAGRAPLPPSMTGQIPAVSWFSARGHVNGGLDALVRLETRDEAAAQNLRDVLQGVLALARLQASQVEPFRVVVDSMAFGGEGTIVSVTFSVPADAIEALAVLRRERRDPRTPAVPGL